MLQIKSSTKKNSKPFPQNENHSPRFKIPFAEIALLSVQGFAAV
jgi:hypothetical protein